MKFVRVGFVSGIYGLDGVIKITPTTEHPEFFDEMEYLLLAKDKAPCRSLKIEDLRPHGALMLVKGEGVEKDVEAKKLVGLDVVIPEDMLPDTPEDEVYWYMIEGATVITESGEKLGILDDYLESGANDIFRVKLDVGGYALISNNKTHVLRIDPAKREIIVDPSGLVSEDI